MLKRSRPISRKRTRPRLGLQPKPAKHKNSYRRRARPFHYLAWIRSLPCAVCGTEREVEAAHSGPHGLSNKSSDWTCLPLCGFTHHREGPHSYHQLGQRFFAYHQIDRLLLIEQLQQAYFSLFPEQQPCEPDTS